MTGADLIVVSNRGPLAFVVDPSGNPVPATPSGGLAGSLRSVLAGRGATWVFALRGEPDRIASEAGMMATDGIVLAGVDVDPTDYAMAYDVVANATLWPLHHHLFDLARRPLLDARWRQAWEAYRSYQEVLAEEVALRAARGATVLVHDYHLALLPGILARLRPDLPVVHFTHTPFAEPGVFRALGGDAAVELLEGMAGARACGFHAERWRAAFVACCEDAAVEPCRSFVSPLVPDAEQLAERSETEACRQARRTIEESLTGRRLLVRVDRLEPSKNILRGFWAFDELLAHRPDLRSTVTMLALTYASRQNLPEYIAYRSEVEQAADRLNARWSAGDWVPVVLDIGDDPGRSYAALGCYDVLLVNPVRDGLNLVAKEGPLLNRSDGVLVLSREAGAFDELAEASLGINPFDVSATAEAMATALDMSPSERSRRALVLRKLAAGRTPGAWLDDQLSAARG